MLTMFIHPFDARLFIDHGEHGSGQTRNDRVVQGFDVDHQRFPNKAHQDIRNKAFPVPSVVRSFKPCGCQALRLVGLADDDRGAKPTILHSYGDAVFTDSTIE